MICLLPTFKLLQYPLLTFLKPGESMADLQEVSNIEAKNVGSLVTILNAEADGVGRLDSNLS
jgi:hypothetical protein